MSDLSLTYHDVAKHRLERLWPALYGTPCPASALARLDTMVLPWGAAPIPSAPEWLSDIGDDHSPYEFSIAFDPHQPPTLRFLCEAQAEAGIASPSLSDTADAALALTRRLAESTPGIDLSRFEKARSLFLPTSVESARFALWHAASLSGTGEAKAYFNPQILGKDKSFGLVERALATLGFDNAWPTLSRLAQPSSSSSSDPTEIRYFSLDLNGGKRARVKVYLYQRNVTLDHLEQMAAACESYTKSEVSLFCEAITESSGPFAVPLCTYLSFVEGNPNPSELTIQIPIRFYAKNDLVARDRISDYMRLRGISPLPYQAALTALAPRSLEQCPGLNTYVSLRAGTARLTVYIATELFGTARRAPSWISRHNPNPGISPDPG